MGIYSVFVIFSLLLLCTNGQSERGLIVTTLGTGDFLHMSNIPYYDRTASNYLSVAIEDGSLTLYSVDVDYRQKTVLFYDSFFSSIIVGYNYNSSLRGQTFSTHHIGVSRGFVQVVVDWLSHTVYWTDSLFRWVIAAPIQQDKLSADHYKIIVDTHLDYPDGIALDPMEGLLFWSDNGIHPKIESSNLQGGDRKTLITSHLFSPMTLEADQVDKRLFWLDSYREELQSVRYDGTDRRLVVRVLQSYLFDVGIFRDLAIITDISGGHRMSFLNKTTGQQLATSVRVANHTMLSVAVFSEEKQPLKDKDYCAELKCPHLCLTTKDGAVCACSEGFQFNETTSQCDEDTGKHHIAIVLASTTQICLIDLRTLAHDFSAYQLQCIYSINQQTTTAAPVTSTLSIQLRKKRQGDPENSPNTPTNVLPNDEIKMMDIDMKGRVIYFSDDTNRIFARPVDLDIQNPAVESIAFAEGTITGMAYDWIDDMLYWCEDSGKIMRVSPRSGAVSLVKDGLFSPEQLMVLGFERQLAWVSDGSIQTLTLASSSVTTVASNLGKIQSIVAKHEDRQYVWVSAQTDGSKRLMRINFDGTNNATLTDDPRVMANTTTLFSAYKGFYKWIYTDPENGVILKTADRSMAIRTGFGILQSFVPISMKILDASVQASQSSPCAIENGDCEQICVTLYGQNTNAVTDNNWSKQCQCRLGFKTDPADSTKCTSKLVDDNFLLVTDWTNDEIHQISLADGTVSAYVTSQQQSISGTIFNPVTKRVIWTYFRDPKIYSANLDGSDMQVIANLGFEYAYRFAFDFTNNNLYYTAYSDHSAINGHVGVITPKGDNLWINEDLNGVLGDIAVHPKKGWMYVTMFVSPGYIAKCNMDGKECVMMVNRGSPDGLAIDYTRDKLYWSNADSGVINQCDLNVENCEAFYRDSNTDFKDLVTDGQYLYITDYQKEHVLRVSLTDKSTKIIGGSLGRVDSVSLFSSTNRNIQPVSEACKARNGLGDCSTICLPTSTGRTCACGEGYELKDDERTCSDVYQCSATIRQSSNMTLTFKDSCLRHINDVCQYICPPGYRPTSSDDMILCTNVGWENETDALCEKDPEVLLCIGNPVSNGKLASTCKRYAREVCDYECNSGYDKNNNVPTVTCGVDGTWQTQNMIICLPVGDGNAAPVTAADAGGLSSAAIGAIVAVLVIIIVALIAVVAVLIYRRKRDIAASQFSYGRASFSNHAGDVAIENPGYRGTSGDTHKKTIDDEYPYSGTAGPQSSNTPSTSQRDEGFTNPLYANTSTREPLPEVAHVSVTQET